jgi:glycosyltransferase involved in cell wall biosynthesis
LLFRINGDREKTSMTGIVQFITSLEMGGTWDDMFKLCARFSNESYRTILVSGGSKISPEKLSCEHIVIASLKRNVSPLNDLITFARLIKLLLKVRPAILHTHSSKAGFIGRWAGLAVKLFSPAMRGLKIVHTPHGHIFYGYGFSPLKTRFYILLEKLTAPLADILVALTEGEKRESLAFGIGKPSQWIIIHSGVQAPGENPDKIRAREALNIPRDSLVTGVVARLERVKGVSFFIEAAKKVLEASAGPQKNSLLFVVAGGGSQKAELEALSKKLGIGTNILFLGATDRPDEAMAAMDLYVQPSLNEGMGKTLVQAQALGLPVIATRVQGIPDTVIDGITAVLVPPADSAALAAAMTTLITRPAQRKSLGDNGRRWVNEEVQGSKRFSFERMLKLHQDLYDKITE